VSLDAVRAALTTDPSRVGLFTDLDGTLAEIVDDPDTVVPVEGVTQRIEALSRRLGSVAVISGRPVSFLERFFAPPVELSGLYGLEHSSGGRVRIDATALEWLPVMTQTAERARSEFGDDVVEDKGYSLTIHYRGAEAEVGERISAWVDSVARETGLQARVAKKSVELHPPTARSKADAVEELLTGIDVALYCGDDVGDIPAFERLAFLDESGTLKAHAIVLVASDETSPELFAYATNTIHGPADMVAVLDGLLAAARA